MSEEMRNALKELRDATRRFLAGYGRGLEPSPRLAEALEAADRQLSAPPVAGKD